MLTFFGVMIALIGAGMLIGGKVIKDGFIAKWKSSWSFIMISIGLLMPFITGAFFYAEGGTAYAVQYIWGGSCVVNTNGPAFKGWGSTIPINYELVVKDLTPKEYAKYIESDIDESDYAYIRESMPTEFNDAVNGFIATAVIVNIDPSDDVKFKKIAFNNKSEKNLVNSRIMSLIDAAKKNTAKLMSAQEYIAGKSAYFDMAFRDQLENGTYQLDEIFVNGKDEDTIGSKKTVRTVNNASESRSKIYKPKLINGKIVREGQGLNEYGLIVRQANGARVDWEDTFDTRLTKQKEQVAETQLEKQKAEKAVYKTKRLYQEGESNKVEEKAKLEKEQLTTTITAETKAKEEEFKLIVAKTAYETEQYKAKTKKVAADAQFYENSKLVAAGLTPQERATFDMNTKIGIEREKAKTVYPSYLVIGGSGGSGNNSELINTAMAKQLGFFRETK